MKYCLTLEQIDCWREQHYLFINDYFNVDQKRALLDWVDDLVSLPEDPNKWMHTYEFDTISQPRLSSIEYFLDKHNRLNQMAQGAKLTAVLTTLMDEKVTLFSENIQFWYPGNSGTPPKQHAFELNTVGPSHHIIIMIGLDSGYIHLPADYKYQQKILAQADGHINPKITNKIKWVPQEYYTGDLIFLDSYLPYFIPPNDSELTRRALFLTYNKVADGGSMRHAYYQNKRQQLNTNDIQQTENSYA